MKKNFLIRAVTKMVKQRQSPIFNMEKEDVKSDEYIRWLCHILGGWLNEGDGNIAAFNYAVKNMPKSGIILEIGSFLGLSTNILAYLKFKHNRDNLFFSCDPWIFENTKEPIGGYFDASSDEYRAYAKKVFQMNSTLFSGHIRSYAIEALSDVFFSEWNKQSVVEDVYGRSVRLGGMVSFAYIDGEHTYAAAKKDFLNVDAKLLPGGFVLFDDSSDDSPFDCKNVMPEILSNPSYELVFKTPNYLFRKRIL